MSNATLMLSNPKIILKKDTEGNAFEVKPKLATLG
jgi:hypothetical protein